MAADSSSSSSAPAAAHPSVDSSLLPPCRHIRVSLADPSSVAHTLDEQAAMFVLDCGYAEDVSLSNLKLVLGVAGVLLTVLAHFYPEPFPANAGVLKACVIVFFLLQGGLQLVHWMVEKDCILLTKRRTEQGDKKDEAAATTNKGGKKGGKASAASASSPSSSSTALPPLPVYALSLQASRTPYSPEFSLTLATRPSESLFAPPRPVVATASAGSASAPPTVGSSTVSTKLKGQPPAAALEIPNVSVTASLRITDYFDANGVMLLEEYHASLRELMRAYANEVARVQASSGIVVESSSGSRQAGSKKKQ